MLANNGLTAPENPPEEDKTIIPPSLKSIDIKTVLRKRNVYTQQQINQNLKNQYIGVAKEILARKNKKKTVEPEKHHQFTNEQVQSYWEKQIRIIEVLEQRFEKKIEQFIGKVVDGFLDHLDQEVNKSIKRVTLMTQKPLKHRHNLISPHYY